MITGDYIVSSHPTSPPSSPIRQDLYLLVCDNDHAHASLDHLRKQRSDEQTLGGFTTRAVKFNIYTKHTFFFPSDFCSIIISKPKSRAKAESEAVKTHFGPQQIQGN